MLVALVWALLEVGFDWWALMPRGGIIILLGLWLAMPWIVGPLRQRTDDGRRGLQAAPLLVSLVIAIVVAVVSMFNAPHDLTGVLPTDVVAQTPNLGDTSKPGDWPDYGRTVFGQRLFAARPDQCQQCEQSEGSVAFPDRRHQGTGRCRRNNL